MARLTDRRQAAVEFLPGRRHVVLAAALTIVVWLAAALGLVVVVTAMSRLSWLHALAGAILVASPAIGLWSADQLRQALRLRAAVTDTMLAQRYHGRPVQEQTGPELPALRPIGTGVADVATRTAALLAGLLAVPSVRIFQGIRPVSPGTVPVTHAVASGRVVVLVESVAWPAGQYELDADGRVVCDGAWIGQSVAPLRQTVRIWRRLLPRNHRVNALVVVHPSGPGRVVLRQRPGQDVALVDAAGCRDQIRSMLSARASVSRHAMVALLAAVQ